MTEASERSVELKTARMLRWILRRFQVTLKLLRRSYRRSALALIACRNLSARPPLFGYGRGKCIDRYYIEQFLSRCKEDIRGSVLEIGDREYTMAFNQGRVERSIVLHAVEGNSEADIVGDLVSGEGIPTGEFDCIILTQTLPVVRDVAAALTTARRALKPGGVLLATVPGISPVSRYDADRWGDFFRFTPLGVKNIFEQCFARDQLLISEFGNRVSATLLINGFVSEECSLEELNFYDADYPVIIACRVAVNEAHT